MIPSQARSPLRGVRHLLALTTVTALTLGAAACGLPAQAVPAAPDGATVVFLVRHGERAEDGTTDPPLSQAGRERAELLARMLGESGITHIFSTDLIRTRSTAGPVAARTGVPVERYAPAGLAALAERVRGMEGRVLIVGHSNTTPELARLLGGEPGAPYDDAEYDRLYVLFREPDGRVTTLRLRFGPPFSG